MTNVFLVYGMTRSGKSTFSESLDSKLRERFMEGTILRTDEVRQRLRLDKLQRKYKESGLPVTPEDKIRIQEERELVYSVVNYIAESISGHSMPDYIIIDGTFNEKRFREELRKSVEDTSNFREIFVYVSEEELLERLKSGEKDKYDSQAGIQAYHAIKSKFQEPTENENVFIVSGSKNANLEEQVERVIRQTFIYEG